MAKCNVCEKTSLIPEVLGGTNVCKMCFMKINGPLWKYRTYEKHEDAEHQRKKAIENAMKHNFPITVLEGINSFFDQQISGMLRCDVCGEVVQTLEKIGEAKLCKKCFSKINIDEWKQTEYADNEEVEENRKKVLKIAQKKGYPSVVVEGINSHFDKKINKDLLFVIKGRGQTLKIFESRFILTTYASFSPEDLASEYAKMKSKAQPNSRLANGADAVVRGLLTGGVVKAGVSLATNVAAGTVVGQISSRSELQSISQGAREIYYENCSDVELIAPNDTELACIKFYIKGSKAEMIFLFNNYTGNINKASKVCSYIISRMHASNQSPVVETGTQQGSFVTSNTSVADEILKYKNLLDMGAITLEEFEAKKRQLLNL